jgi:hypothetical protein
VVTKPTSSRRGEKAASAAGPRRPVSTAISRQAAMDQARSTGEAGEAVSAPAPQMKAVPLALTLTRTPKAAVPRISALGASRSLAARAPGASAAPMAGIRAGRWRRRIMWASLPLLCWVAADFPHDARYHR